MSKVDGEDQKHHALWALTDPALIAFRKSLAAVGCVFDFSVYALEQDIDPSPALHRCALELFFTEVRKQWLADRRETIDKYPRYRESDFFQFDFDCAAAIPEALSPEKLLRLLSYASHQVDAPSLFCSFKDPPYGFAEDADAQGLFGQWCQILGLIPGNLPEVIDWVGDPDLEPSRSEWSNYFEAGKEWWGIWCLTVWNPVTRTLGVLAASTTD